MLVGASPGDIHPRERESFAGSYDEEHNVILINPRYLECNLVPLLADLEGAPDNASESHWWCKASEIREVLSHELGHYFVDLVIEAEVRDSWLQEHLRKKTRPGVEATGLFIVREGIGSYFGEAFTHKTPDFAETTWSAQLTAEEFEHADVRDWLFYKGGYALVKPIIDEYGIEGIRYLLQYPLVVKPPGIEELSAYQKKALETLVE